MEGRERARPSSNGPRVAPSRTALRRQQRRGTSRLFVRPRPTATGSVDHLFSPKFMPRCARRERNNG